MIPEFENLSQDEIRVLREHRALKAISTRPVNAPAATLRLLRMIRDAARIGKELNPSDPFWKEIIDRTPPVVLPED